MSESSAPGIDALIGIWRRRWWIGVLLFVLPFVAAVTVIRTLPNTYRSTATILVEHQQVPESFVRSTVTSALETRLQTINQEILSRARLQSLISQFGLYPELRAKVPAELVIARMRKDIELDLRSSTERPGSGTTVAFTIGFRGGDPHTVADVANTLASSYIAENLKARERQATGTSQFLKAQLEDTKKVLDAQEERLSQYKRRYLGELPQQMSANLTSLDHLGNQLRTNSDQQTRALWRRDALAAQLTEVERSAAARAVPSPASDDSSAPTVRLASRPPTPASIRLQRLRELLTELRTRYSDRHPDVMRMKAEILVVERDADREEREAAREALEAEAAAARPGPGNRDGRRPEPSDPLIGQLQTGLREATAEIEALRQEEARLRDAYGLYQRRVDNTPKREQEFEELSRGHKTTQEHYQSLLKRSEEAQLAEDMEQRQKGEQFRIVEPAIASQQTSAPNRGRLLLMAFVLSLGLAVGAMLLTEHLDTSFHSVEDLRAFTAVPVLVSVARIVTAADVRRRRRRAQAAVLASMVGIALVVAAGHFVARGNEQLVWILARGGS
jgi:polysaccharide chain length determinant protein (PEP-CTERM system associated)